MYATTAFNSLDESRGGTQPAMRPGVPRATHPEIIDNPNPPFSRVVALTRHSLRGLDDGKKAT